MPGREHKIELIVLSAVDICVIALSLHLAFLARQQLYVNVFDVRTGAMTFTILTYIMSFYIFDVNNVREKVLSISYLSRYIVAISFATVIVVVIFYSFPPWKLGRGLALINMSFITLLCFLSRLLLQPLHSRTSTPRRILIVVLGQCMKELVEGKLDNKCKEKVINIPNWADGEYIRPIQKEDNWFAKEHSLVDKTVVLHSGNMGLGHQLETVIEAAEMLKAEDIVFLFIGDGGKRTKLERMVSERGLGNVMFLPYQPYRDLPYSISCSDITVVALEKGIEGICVPCKLYAFMATGRPVIGLLGQQSETARVIDASGCGYRFDQDDVEGFANAVLYLHKNKTEAKSMGMRAREYFDRNFTRQRISRQYYELLKGLERP